MTPQIGFKAVKPLIRYGKKNCHPEPGEGPAFRRCTCVASTLPKEGRAQAEGAPFATRMPLRDRILPLRFEKWVRTPPP